MAEEKAGLDIDDWLDDLEDDTPAAPAVSSPAATASGGDLDQSDIDALLGGGGAPAAAPSSPPPAASGDLDQSDIDSLFASPVSAAPPSSAGAASGGDLDQSDIDALLGGAPSPPSSPAADASGELDQSDIDSLFATAAPPASESAPAAATGGDLDQSDIDSLFAAAPTPPEPPPAASRFASSDDDLDQLFEGLDDTTDGMQTVGFEEVAKGVGADSAGEESFGLPDDTSGFGDDDEFDFGDLPDIPDETEGMSTSGASMDEDIFGGSTTGRTVEPDLAKILAEETPHARQEIPIEAPHGKPAGAGRAMNKKLMAFAVLALAALGGGGYYYLQGKKAVEAPPAVVQEQPPAPPVNAPPEVADVTLRLAKPGEAVSFVLTAKDKEGEPLQFEILSPPRYGVLSGDVPSLTYIPNPDFPGEDSFEFRASDGKHASPPAKVMIAGQPAPPPVAVKAEVVKEKKAEAPPKEEKPELPQLAAGNARLRTKSTAPLIIDWKKIWAQTSQEEPPEGLAVEIVGHDLRGSLARQDRTRHRYEPDRYFGGRGVVRYRFSAAGYAPSKTAQVTITVDKNDKPPKVALAPVAREYTVGEKVVLDAGKSSDDSPGGLRFSWEQVAGVPVRLVPMNAAGSMVSFVAPSSFQQQDRIALRVIAVDPGGQQASKEIEVTTVSRRRGHSPLWGY